MDVRYNEILHPGTNKEWKRDCKTLCSQSNHMCRNFTHSGDSGTLGNRGKQINDRMKPQFKTDKFVAQRKKIAKKSVKPKDQIGYGVQAHHLLSSSKVLLKKFKKFALACAYDLNNGWNCIFLPSNFGYQKWDDLQRHKGNHDEIIYYSKIVKILKGIIKGVNETHFCEKDKMIELHKRFHEKENTVYNDFKKNRIWLYSYAQDAFSTYDYRSEKGNSKEKYEKWDKKTRHKDGFYTGRNYPVP